MRHEQIKQIILDLSMALENFIEANGIEGYRGKSPVQQTVISQQNNQKSKGAVRFHRPSRKNSNNNPAFAANDSSSSSSSSSSSTNSRKRSWDSDVEMTATQDTTEGAKRSKSLVLTQELEGLCLSTTHAIIATESSSVNNPNLLRINMEMNEWIDQDLSYKGNNNNSNITTFDVLKREIESSHGIDQILRVLSCCPRNIIDRYDDFSGSSTFAAASSGYLNHWIKWAVINETCESIRQPGTQLKLILNRSAQLLVSLHRISLLIDWSDPEILFLSHKFLITLLNLDRFRCPNVASRHAALSLNRRLEEFIALLRILNLFSRLPIPKSSFNFLLSRQDTSNQVIRFLESLLEANLNIFELTATLNAHLDTLNTANFSVFLTVKIIEMQICGNDAEIDELILNVKRIIQFNSIQFNK